MNANCRIGKVTMKHGNLQVFHPRPKGLVPEDIKASHRHIDMIADWFDGNLGALLVIGIGMDGKYMRGTRIHVDFPYRPTLLPSFVAEILRSDVTDMLVDEHIRTNYIPPTPPRRS